MHLLPGLLSHWMKFCQQLGLHLGLAMCPVPAFIGRPPTVASEAAVPIDTCSSQYFRHLPDVWKAGIGYMSKAFSRTMNGGSTEQASRMGLFCPTRSRGGGGGGENEANKGFQDRRC